MLSLSRQLAWAARVHPSESPQRPQRLRVEQLLAGAPDPYVTLFTGAGVLLITMALLLREIVPTSICTK
jgi:hypothetical protein